MEYEEKQFKRIFKFAGTKLGREEHYFLCKVVEQKFLGEGLIQFDCKLPRGKSLRIKFVRSNYTKVDGCPHVNTHFKVTPEASDLRLKQMIRKLRSQIKMRKEKKFRRSEYSSKFDYKAHTYSI